MTARIEVRVVRNRIPALLAADWTVPHNRIAAYFIREWNEMFATTGASRGHKWQELTASTLIQKAKAGRSTEIMQRTGFLRASGRPLVVSTIGLDFGTDVSYAKYHDSDKTRKLKASGGPRLPQRKLAKATRGDAQVSAKVIRDWILETLGGAT